jgi:hypothetical protein
MGEHPFEPLALQVGRVMVQLVSQRRQRPTARSTEHDLSHQVASERLRHHAARYAKHVS